MKKSIVATQIIILAVCLAAALMVGLSSSLRLLLIMEVGAVFGVRFIRKAQAGMSALPLHRRPCA